jgi:hypothetical protein
MSPSEDVEKHAARSAVASVPGNRSDSPEILNDPRAILKYLYRLNQLYAQMVVYKDYINLTREPGLDFAATSKYLKDLEEHLYRYCRWKTVTALLVTWLYRLQSLQYHIESRSNFRIARAKKEYKAFVAAHKEVRSTTSETSKLLMKIAGQIPAVDDDKQQLQKPSDDLRDCFQKLIRILPRDGELQMERDAEIEKAEEKAEEKKRKKLLRYNLMIALFGSFALVIPMLIMTLHQTKLTALLTTSSFVLAVAVILAATNAEAKDITTATAGYAAVLVVFVGTGTGSIVATSLSRAATAGIVIGVLAAALTVLFVSIEWVPKFTVGLEKIAALSRYDSDLLEEEYPELESASRGAATPTRG